MRQAVQLCAPTAATGADQTLFTTPASTVTILRMVNVCNTTAGAVTFSLAVGGTTATAANCLNSGQSVPANSTVQVFGPIVLPASTAVHALGSVAGVTFEASGDQSVAGG